MEGWVVQETLDEVPRKRMFCSSILQEPVPDVHDLMQFLRLGSAKFSLFSQTSLGNPCEKEYKTLKIDKSCASHLRPRLRSLRRWPA